VGGEEQAVGANQGVFRQRKKGKSVVSDKKTTRPLVSCTAKEGPTAKRQEDVKKEQRYQRGEGAFCTV